MAKKAAKRGKTRSKKARKKTAKKTAKKAVKLVRRKTAKARRKAAKKAATRRKTAKKAARRKTAKKAVRRKAAKKAVRRPKAAKKAAKTKRPAKSAPKAAKPVAPKPPAPIAPTAAPKPAAPRSVAPAAPAMAPKASEPGRAADVRATQPRPAPKPQPAPTPQPGLKPLAGHFDPGIERYYSMLAQNTPESHRLGTLQIDRILATNPNDVVALAEKAHDIVNNWRNDVLSEETIKECQIEFATGDPFTCAHRWAQRSIDAAKAQGIVNPYGPWARAYVYKYQKQPSQSVADYRTALGFKDTDFIGRTGRRKKDLVAEWLEGLVYWARRDQLEKVVNKIKTDVQPDPGKSWINWVKCFALHLLGRFADSNALYPDYLPDDRDVNLIIAANYARLGREDLRQLHRKLFLEKDGNANWSAAKETERSPFADKGMRDFWYESVDKALRASAAPPSAAPTQSI